MYINNFGELVKLKHKSRRTYMFDALMHVNCKYVRVRHIASWETKNSKFVSVIQWDCLGVQILEQVIWEVYTLGVKVRNMKMDFNTGSIPP